ncbi:hypothetical protein PGB90_005282 [Kerria lacca]
MFHGPHSDFTPCWNKDKKLYTKNFSKSFINETDMNTNDFPNYKRQSNKSKVN